MKLVAVLVVLAVCGAYSEPIFNPLNVARGAVEGAGRIAHAIFGGGGGGDGNSGKGGVKAGGGGGGGAGGEESPAKLFTILKELWDAFFAGDDKQVLGYIEQIIAILKARNQDRADKSVLQKFIDLFTEMETQIRKGISYKLLNMLYKNIQILYSYSAIKFLSLYFL